MIEYLVSFLVFLFIPLIPIYTTWTHPNWKGVFVGAVTLWIFFFLGNLFLVTHYGGGEGPDQDAPIAGMMTMIWLIVGLAPSAIFCAFVAVVRRRLKKPSNEGASIPSTEGRKVKEP